MVSVVGIRGSVKAVSHITGGIGSLGDTYSLADNVSDTLIHEADCFLQTNMLKPKFKTADGNGPYETILKTGKPFLVQESANFRKHLQYQRLGWYSYKWTEGIFGNENSPPDRWNKFVKETGTKIKDWKSGGDYILLMGQKEGDSSLTDLYFNGVKTFNVWVQNTVDTIRKYTDRPIVIRPHPRGLRGGMKGAQSIKGTNLTISQNTTKGGAQGGEGLERDIKNAYCVVTYNSLSAIESVCEGIPTFALHNGSMVWPIAHKDLSQIENLNYNIDITQWCNDIAYTQWNFNEHRSGESWAHLKPLIFKESQ